MDKKIKLAVIGLAGLLLVSFFIIFQLNSVKQGLERQIEKLQTDISGLAKQMDNLSLEKRRLEEKAGLAKDDLDRVMMEKEELAKKFAMADQARQDLVERLKSVSTQGEALKKQVDNLTTQKKSVEKELVDLKAKRELYRKKYSQMSQILKDRPTGSTQESAAIIHAPGIVELPPIIVRPKPSTAAVSSGKIIAINREDNFVVVDIGKSSGLKIGSRVKVIRGEKLIGDLELIEIREMISACDIKNESQAFKVGDLVK